MGRPEHEVRRFRLGPRSTRGLVAGWRSGQIGCVAAGLLVAVALLRSVGGAPGVLLAFLVACGGIAAATWRIGGQTPEQWLPIAAAFGVRACAEARHRPWLTNRGPRGTLSRFSLLHLPEPGNWEPAWRESLEELAQRVRGEHSGSSPIELPKLSATGVAVIDDNELATWTAVVPAGGTGFALLAEAERSERIAAWSGVLAAMARDTVGLHRLQWVSSAHPAWLDGELPAVASSGTPGRHYRQFVREASPSLWNQDVYIALTVSRRKGRRGGAEPASVLREQLASLCDRLEGAGLDAGEALSPLRLARLVRRSFEVAPAQPSTAWPWPWPVAVDDGWSCLRTDACWHATYWIAEWPRCEVGAGFMLPLLLEPQLRRVVSLTMAPVAASLAVRRAERERTEGTADAELRRRHGFAVTARALKEQEGRHQRETELAEGHAGYRYSAYVTVTDAEKHSLERACGRLEQAAALAQLDLRRLYGAQEEAYCCTLPAGRGCP